MKIINALNFRETVSKKNINNETTNSLRNVVANAPFSFKDVVLDTTSRLRSFVNGTTSLENTIAKNNASFSFKDVVLDTTSRLRSFVNGTTSLENTIAKNSAPFSFKNLMFNTSKSFVSRLAKVSAVGMFMLGSANLFSQQPIEISNKTQWDNFAASPISGGNYVLTADIGSPNNPVTEMVRPFSGTFDGQGHTVYVNISSDASYVGLFSSVGTNSNSNSTIQNLTVAGSITATDPMSACIGGIAGRSLCQNGTIKFINCSNKAIIGFTSDDIYKVGGITGYVSSEKDVYFYNCTNYVHLPKAREAGGIAAMLTVKDKIYFYNCANFGHINGTAINGHVGGIASCVYSGGILEIINCVNNGNITSVGEVVGGIIGYIQNSSYDALINASITSCKNGGNITGASGYMGGILGYVSDYYTVKRVVDAEVIVIDTIEVCDTNITPEDTLLKFELRPRPGEPIIIIECDKDSNGNIIKCDTNVQMDTTWYTEFIPADTSITCYDTTVERIDTMTVDSVFRGRVNMSGCVNIGKIIDTTNSSVLGGLIGSLIDGNIFNCVNAGIVDGGATVGGIIGTTPCPGPVSGFPYDPDIPNVPSLKINISSCINTNWIDGTCAGAIIGYKGFYSDVSNCFYDSQMCVKQAICEYESDSIGNYLPVAVGMFGKSTEEMIGDNLHSLSGWIKEDRIYPRVGDHIVDKLSAAPIYLKNQEKVNSITYSFPVSNFYIYPFKWGFYGSYSSFKSASFNEDVVINSLNIGKIVNSRDDWDSLVVRLFPNTTAPIFEKWVPINVSCRNIAYTDTTNTDICFNGVTFNLLCITQFINIPLLPI